MFTNSSMFYKFKKMIIFDHDADDDENNRLYSKSRCTSQLIIVKKVNEK